MSRQGIYRFSSIGRPLEPEYPSNRAVLFLLPVAAVIGAVLAWLDGAGATGMLQAGALIALIGFGTWALAREFDPDHDAAAFIAMAVGFLTAIFVDGPGILLLFATLGLVRMVNRSTGLTARMSDSVILLLLTILIIYTTNSPLFGLAAGLAFILDGSLREPLRSQWVFGLISMGATVVYLVDHGMGPSLLAVPKSLYGWLALLFLLIFALNALLLKSVQSTGDCSDKPLNPGRVRAGMAVGLLAALQGIHAADKVVLVVVVIAAVGAAMAFRRSFRSPAKS
ncbi:MAG: hypothetical protein RQ826_10470 [Xanthomonadales bacterium]|nr:hypothetical protein [Xanthomonadales bacterium]